MEIAAVAPALALVPAIGAIAILAAIGGSLLASAVVAVWPEPTLRGLLARAWPRTGMTYRPSGNVNRVDQL